MRKLFGFGVALIVVCGVFGALFDVVGLVSLVVLALTIWGFLLLLAIYLGWWAVYGLGCRRWKPKLGLVTVPLAIAGLALASLIGNSLAAPPAVLPEEASVSQQLEAMLRSDQSDRWSGRFFTMPWRDRKRLERTRKLLGSEPFLEPKGQFAAAMLLQHGSEPSDFERAHGLAQSAYRGGVEEAESLAKAAYDRWQISIGKPQKYGTQSKIQIGLGGIRVEDP